VFVVEVQLFQKVELLGSKTVFFPLFITLAINHDILCHQSYGSLKYPLPTTKKRRESYSRRFHRRLGCENKKGHELFCVVTLKVFCKKAS
jgi:hypothetical protein